MTNTLLLGRQYQNTLDSVITAMIQSFRANPAELHFLIVPNHIKFDSEVHALKMLRADSQAEISVTNFQVLSLSRLAWFLTKDLALQNLPVLSETTASMILKRILLACQSKLSLYQKTEITAGLVEQIYHAILQIQEGNLTVADLTSASQGAVDLETKTKLADLAIIYQEFLTATSNQFRTQSQVSADFNKLLLTNPAISLSQMNFYFSEFSHFSKLELQTLRILMAKAKQVWLGLKTGSAIPTDYDYLTNQIIQQLQEFDPQLQIKSITKQAVSDPIKDLNIKWVGVTADQVQITTANFQEHLELTKANSSYDEAYHVGQSIYQIIATNPDIRYQDFLILAPSLSQYETYLGPILKQLAIPYFNDLQKEMKYHQLVLMIDTLRLIITEKPQIQLNRNNFLTLLKTGMFVPAEYQLTAAVDLIDQLENFLLEYGLDYSALQRDLQDFVMPETLTADKLADITQLNDFKNTVIHELTTLQKKLAQTTDTKTALGIFYDFLISNQAIKILEQKRETALAQGDLELAVQPEQVLSTLNSLLQDYLTINPANFAINDFFAVLQSGFSVANFAQIPSTLDAVTVSELGMVQTQKYRHTFIIGATSTDLPEATVSGGYFSADNIEQLNQNLDVDQQLENSQPQKQLNADYLFGQALVTAKETIHLSYPQLNVDNNLIKPSPYYRRLLQFNHYQEYLQTDLPDATTSSLLSFITNPLNTYGYLAFLAAKEPAEVLTNLKAETLAQLPPEIQAQLRNSEKFDNQPQKITQDEAVGLFGKDLSLSVSQLEAFYANPYDYFLNYGLRLQPRAENDFDSLQTGNYFHRVFELFVRETLNSDLTKLSRTQAVAVLTKIEQQLKQDPYFKHYLTNPLNSFLAQRLDQTANIIITTWLSKLQQTNFRPAAAELLFGFNNPEAIPGLTKTSSDQQHQIKVRGKIDRLDTTEIAGQTYGQVVDYKSSKHSFNLNLFMSGIQMQLITYLEVIKQQGILPFGAVYQTITANPVNPGDVAAANYFYPKEFNDQLKLGGLFINDLPVSSEILPAIEKDFNLYRGINPTKKGLSFGKATSLSAADLDLLFAQNEQLITKAADQIYAGDFPLSPYQNNETNGLKNSAFKDILYFDTLLPTNKYHEIPKRENAEIMQDLREQESAAGKEDEL